MSNYVRICHPKQPPYGITLMHGPHRNKLCDVHIWIKTLKKSLRFPLRKVEIKGEEPRKQWCLVHLPMILGLHEPWWRRP